MRHFKVMGIEFGVGDHWVENDPRLGIKRVVTIVGPHPTLKTHVLISSASQDVTRVTKAKAERFDGRRGGYSRQET